MKLRNKKTGEIVGLSIFGISLNIRKEEQPTYHSIEQLCEDWEDVGSTNNTNIPLTKDDKIRKAVRAWADANEVTKVYVYGIGDGKEYIELYAKDDGVIDGRIRISLPTQDGVRIGEEYAIEELCGSEEIEILEPTYTTIEEKEKLKEEE